MYLGCGVQQESIAQPLTEADIERLSRILLTEARRVRSLGAICPGL
jgi:hypothetical protein